MTREEIREGIDMRSPIPQAINRAFLHLLEDYRTYLAQPDPLRSTFVSLDEYLARGIASLMTDLHSQGVVIKVDRELPNWLMEGQEAFDTEQMGLRVKKAGYVAFAPLIKD